MTFDQGRTMQTTRQQILDYLRLHREATVKDLSLLLGLTATGVRQHLTTHRASAASSAS